MSTLTPQHQANFFLEELPRNHQHFACSTKLPSKGGEALPCLVIMWEKKKTYNSSRAVMSPNSCSRAEQHEQISSYARTWRSKVGRKKLLSAFDVVFQIPPELFLNKIRLAFAFSRNFPSKEQPPFTKQQQLFKDWRSFLRTCTSHLWLQNYQSNYMTF